MFVPDILHDLPGAQNGFPACLMVRKTERWTVKCRFFHFIYFQFFPVPVIFLFRPERMILWQVQAQERFPHPKRRLRAGIPLHKRGKLPVKAHGRDSPNRKIISR